MNCKRASMLSVMGVVLLTTYIVLRRSSSGNPLVEDAATGSAKFVCYNNKHCQVEATTREPTDPVNGNFIDIESGVAATKRVSLMANYEEDSNSSSRHDEGAQNILENETAIPSLGLNPQPRDRGFALALSYSDQLTASVFNLISLQCWAFSLGPNMRVVEPFLRRSVLGVDDQHRINSSEASMKSVKLTDVYDKDQWDLVINYKNDYAPLISWDNFIKYAQRKMIVVERECRYNLKGKCMECGDDRTKDFLHSIQVLTSRYGFEVVHRVCYPMKPILDHEFKKLIYKNYSRHEVVVVFNYWGGIGNDSVWRIVISDEKMNRCQRHFQGNFPLSTQLKNDAAQYTQKFIHTNRYISVMVRLELFYIKHNRFKGASNDEIFRLLTELYNDIFNAVLNYKVKYNVTNIFLTMDCREQGSDAFSRTTNRDKMLMLMSDSIASLYRMLFGNSSSLEEWDESFYSVSSFRNEGYIAMLQKYLAASGTCLVTAGGGAFQGTARMLYNHYHPRNKCVHVIEG